MSKGEMIDIANTRIQEYQTCRNMIDRRLINKCWKLSCQSLRRCWLSIRMRVLGIGEHDRH